MFFEFTKHALHIKEKLDIVRLHHLEQLDRLFFEKGYFDNASATKPLLHLWSLGIEEQFYIF